MGGFGSGRRSNRPTTDECIRIELPLLKRLGMLKRGCMNRRSRIWTREGKTIAELTLVADIDCRERYPCLKMTGHAFGRKIDHLILLDSVPNPASPLILCDEIGATVEFGPFTRIHSPKAYPRREAHPHE